LVLTSAARRPGRTRRARISEKATDIELTTPKSLITGIGDSRSTMNPQIVVPADISRADPVLAYMSFIAGQIAIPDARFDSNLLQT
jgi:hypothetical protein